MNPWIALCCILTAAEGSAMTPLNNGTLRLELDVNAAGTPYIAAVAWDNVKKPLMRETALDLEAWAPDGFEPEAAKASPWKIVEHPVFLRAESSRAFKGDVTLTWVVDLAREGSLYRMHVRMANNGDAARPVAWFPIWQASWDAPAFTDWCRWWQALSFQSVERPLTDPHAVSIKLGSRLHSSDADPAGQNPYWVLGGRGGRVYCALDWCGGWRAELGKVSAKAPLLLDLRLPPEETQLVLNPGEAIDGPVLNVTITPETDDLASRASWMRQRVALGKALYGGPEPWYPLAYNNWYTTRFSVDGPFLKRQVEAMDPYKFDVFVVDAGWYEAVGKWQPDPKKFAPDEFENLLKTIRSKRVRVGIWTCPQFVSADKDHLPPEVDQPGFYRKFIDGYLLDYAGMDFTQFLLDHVANLRSRYGADWWKYDQDFFTPETRHGVMKNVVALQNALLAVRKAQPDLYLENCQSGGRMINEFTVLLTQNQWIRDGGNTGPGHARSNFREALGTLEFLPPWTVNRWTNNPDRNDPEDDAFTRMYCRSAMAGTWGIVADLPNIAPRQRDIILAEAAHYRRLNALKTACRYEIIDLANDAPACGIVYYDTAGQHAAVLLLRWAKEGAFDFRVDLDTLAPAARCRIEDVDAAAPQEIDGATLREQGLSIPFDAMRQSALVFIDALD